MICGIFVILSRICLDYCLYCLYLLLSCPIFMVKNSIFYLELPVNGIIFRLLPEKEINGSQLKKLFVFFILACRNLVTS